MASKSSGRPRPRSGNLATATADRLREMILDGKLVPGAALRELELCRVLGVSRNPLREAFHRLEGEGLVRIRPNRGAVVARLSPHEVHEVVEACRLIETHLLRLAVRELDPADLDSAEALLTRMDSVREPASWARLNWRFHLLLYGAADRPLLLALVDGLRRRVERELLASLRQEGSMSRFNAEHRGILAEVRRRRAAAAAELLDAHLQTGLDEIVRMLDR